MPSRRDNSFWKSLPFLSQLLIGLLVCVTVLFVLVNGSAAVLGISSPFLRIAQSIPPFAYAAGWVMSKDDLVVENERLTRELANAKEELATHAELVKQNAELLATFGRKSESEDLLYARVLSAPPASGYDSLVVDVGTDAGVRVGDVVLSGPHSLLGVVANVYGRQAKIDLYSTYGMQFEALIGKNETPITVTGRGGGNWSATLPKDVDVGLGDTVIVPSRGFRILGTVGSLEKAKESALDEVLIAAPANIYSLPAVYVVRNAL